MFRKRLPRAAAALLLAAALCLALPAAATALGRSGWRPTAAPTGGLLSLFADAWSRLASLLGGGGAAGQGRTAAWEKEGHGADPDGKPHAIVNPPNGPKPPNPTNGPPPANGNGDPEN